MVRSIGWGRRPPLCSSVFVCGGNDFVVMEVLLSLCPRSSLALEKGIKEMAKKLKKKGIDIDIIAETSGLSKEEIEKS